MAGSAVAAILTAALILVCVSLAFIKSDSLLQKVDQLSLTDPIDDALATGREFTVPGGLNDAVPRSKSGIQSAEAKLARFQSLYDDEKMSEAELAGRLSRAIDEHEKCRRHWPHLESLEAAQEIRVHDARNNLEVANRAMERARKELQDAEGLVLAARQEHQTYETQRTEFQEFKTQYDAETSSMKSKARYVQLYQMQESKEAKSYSEQVRRARDLTRQEELLQDSKNDILSKEHEEMQALQSKEHPPPLHKPTVEISHLKPKLLKRKTPLLSKIRAGIVVPADVSDRSEDEQREGRMKKLSALKLVRKLREKQSELSKKEIDAFANLPHNEKKIVKLDKKIASLRRQQGLDHSRIVVAKENLRSAEEHNYGSKKIKLLKEKLVLARVDDKIKNMKLRKDEKAKESLVKHERDGPKYSRQLTEVQSKLKELEAEHPDILKELDQARETELVELSSEHQAQPKKNALPEYIRRESKKELRKKIEANRKRLQSIRDELLAVQTKLRAQQQEVGVHEQKLRDRHHEVKHSTTLLMNGNSQELQELTNVYEDKLRALHEERKKADGLLAKAERMLNVARLDSLHASRTKAAALEELSYATAKLRRYQDLRSHSQRCQMDAWSEIRELTHRARSNKLLEGKDLSKIEVLRQVVDDAKTQELAQI